ncbi:helix-turn-helix transcriptional regulator [Kribbella sp. NPDC026611]|uniref:helix-turn-helix transcriptional regulator n=1 Tax=Kribbella sp. NPDC026611 TaxID=3154911 RepID=UPI0033CEF178
MTARLNVSPQVAVILYEAYAKISGRMGRNHYAMYDYVRVVMSKITTVDSFYVGLLHGGNRVRFPYSFDGHLHDDSDSHTFGQHGLTAWLLVNKKTYRYSMDRGALLSKGVSFGDVRKVSEDAVAVPMLRPSSDGEEVFGMLSMQSYAAGTYNNDAVSALEWLTDIVARVLMREREDRDALSDLRLNISEELQSTFLTSDHIVEYLVEQVGEVRRKVEDAVNDDSEALGGLRAVLQDVILDCRRIQAELVELTLTADDRPTQRFMSLTPAEQTIALLVADGLSNQEIADELSPTSVNTVKTHLKSISAKYGMSRRNQIASDVRRHLGNVNIES